MALEVATNPCGLLQDSATAVTYATGVTGNLYAPSVTATTLTTPQAFFTAAGVMREFGEWTAGPSGSILTLLKASTTSKYRLVQFLSGGGAAAAAAAATPAKTYANYPDTLLGTGTGIVKTYFKATAKGGVGSYTYTSTSPLLADKKLWDALDVDATTYTLKATPASIIGNLMKDGFLLKPTQIFTPGDTTAGNYDVPTSLFQIYATENSAGQLTSAQQSTKTMLECTNLRFFGAFFIEYCYYRSRYSALLDLYFNVYTTSTTTYIPPTGNILTTLFNNSGTVTELKYSTPGPSQSEYLTAIAYHLACLNTRLVDLRRLLTMVNSLYSTYYTQLQSTLNNKDVNGSTTAVTNALTALQLSAEDTKDYLSEADYRQGVMEYASEKNRYSNILLGVYAFLNLSALAVVVYSM